MSVHLPVLSGPAEVTAETDRFRCERLRTVVGAKLCMARHTARHRGPKPTPVYLGCAECRPGAELHARLTGTSLPAPAPAPAPSAPTPSRPPRGRWTDHPAGTRCPCGTHASSYLPETPEPWRDLCGRHRRRASLMLRARGDGADAARAASLSGERVYAPAEPQRCALPGCERHAGRETVRTRVSELGLCVWHRTRVASAAERVGGERDLARRRVEARARGAKGLAGMVAAGAATPAELARLARRAELAAKAASKPARPAKVTSSTSLWPRLRMVSAGESWTVRATATGWEVGAEGGRGEGRTVEEALGYLVASLERRERAA